MKTKLVDKALTDLDLALLAAEDRFLEQVAGEITNKTAWKEIADLLAQAARDCLERAGEDWTDE